MPETTEQATPPLRTWRPMAAWRAILRMDRAIRWKVWGPIFLVLCGLLIWDFCDQDDGIRGYISRARGNQIINALYEYKRQNGCYPESLSKLTPVYIGKLPKPLIGDAFEYSVYAERTKFTLEFPAEWGYVHVFDSERPGWSAPQE